jgi:hypothetical protein
MTFYVGGLAGSVAPVGGESQIALAGANQALNAPNALAPDAANDSGAGAAGVGMGITVIDSKLWAAARGFTGSGSGAIQGSTSAAITAAINAGLIVVLQA